MVIDFARPGIAELLEDAENLPGISSGSIKLLDDLAGTLAEGTPNERKEAYTTLHYFVKLFEGQYNVPSMQEYQNALCAYEQSREPAY